MHVETQLARRDGTRFWASILTTFLVEGGSLSHVISVVRDISRQKELESQLLHAQKMEAIGTLAGGVAHDMNNILAAILSLGNVMQIKGGCKDANEIVQAAKRGKALVEQLLGFARKGRYDPRPIVMDDEVRGVMRILERSISKKISLETAFEAPRIQVEGDSLQLSQAVLNVCLNARDAITEHGQIRIASSVVHVSESKPVAGLDSGRYYRLTVVDDGHGMPPEVLLRVFDPFFSTKDVGSGTGLGLSMAYGVVQSHGGLIQIESQPNKGATVTFWFPTLEGEAMTDSRAEQSSGPAQKKKGSLRVMLVDDEWMIRESLTRLLEALGHSTLTAESGARAITSFREYYDTIDIVLLDISMPEMDGAECFTALREIDPEARIIVCSGHGGAGTVQKLLDAGALGFLRKPFDVQSLTRALDTFSAPR